MHKQVEDLHMAVGLVVVSNLNLLHLLSGNNKLIV